MNSEDLLIWIITGGVACGKSMVMRHLSEMCGSLCQSFCCDEAVHRLYEDPKRVGTLVKRFGKSILADDGSGGIDRAALRQKVLADANGRRDLESLVHPLVLDELETVRRKAKEETGVKLLVAEVPLYYEIGAVVRADQVIVVASSPTLQIRRLMEHRGLSQASGEAFLAAQHPLAAKVDKASRVIWNDGDPSALEDQVGTLIPLII